MHDQTRAGVVKRKAHRPVHTWATPTLALTLTPGEDWIWSDQTESWRPPNATYNSDLNVLVFEGHHDCPWVVSTVCDARGSTPHT